MSTFYLIALTGVGAALIAALLDALWSVSRRPAWDAIQPRLSLVETEERRLQPLAFVGTERREAGDAAEAVVSASRQAA